MNGNLEVSFDRREIENYVMDILTIGECRLFFPVTFVKSPDEITATFRVDGYRSLASIGEIATEDILTVAISLIQGIYEAERHYIFAIEYDIDETTVWMDRGFHSIKVLFRPAKAEKPVFEKVIEVIEAAAKSGSSEGRGYVDDAVEFIRQNPAGYKAVIHHLEKLRKEVYLCGIA